MPITLFQSNSLIVKNLKLVEHSRVSNAMHEFTNNRDSNTLDEIWLVEHPKVFTQGKAGKEEHVLDAGDIPVIQTDRGGQVTYHGPGQLVAYFMLDLRRIHLSVRDLVSLIENTVIDTLKYFDINAATKPNAPGVYVNGDKICSLGLRIQKGCSFHGLALNVDMDLEPFNRINPCGYAGLKMVQISDFTTSIKMNDVETKLISIFIENLKLKQDKIHIKPVTKH